MGLKPQGIDLNPRKCHNIESMFQSLRASASKNVILFSFTISKSNFITYTIPFYNTPYIIKLYSFTFLLKYYFLIFLYYIFSIIIFFQDSNCNIFLGFRTFFFFFRDLHSPTITFSWAMQHYFFSNSDVDSSGLSLAFIISFQQSFVFSNSTIIPNNLPIKYEVPDVQRGWNKI